jgi:hypothetical protein
MATRSRIAVETTDNGGERVVKSVYCHSDGYVEGVGTDLMRTFPNGTDPKEVEAYIEEGDRSTTDLSYKEWRGEECPPMEHKSVPDFFNGDIEEYGYLYTAEGEWLVKRAASRTHKDPVPLAYVFSKTLTL